jgi:prepilin-type N-terminal cleavage/methylation domain-containing protein
MKKQVEYKGKEAGFSLVELIIAMTLTLVVLTIATTLLARSLNIRTRANDNVDALADAERALNIMSREISQAGFNLVTGENGIVAGDSIIDGNGNSTIRIRANLNRFNTAAPANARNGISVADWDAGEDVQYYIYPAGQTTLLARYDAYDGAGTSTVLANKLDKMRVHYFAQKVTYSTPAATETNLANCDITAPSAAEVLSPRDAKYVVIAVCVRQQAVGVPGGAGYQPPHLLLLTSDVALRNANLVNY